MTYTSMTKEMLCMNMRLCFMYRSFKYRSTMYRSTSGFASLRALADQVLPKDKHIDLRNDMI